MNENTAICANCVHIDYALMEKFYSISAYWICHPTKKINYQTGSLKGVDYYCYAYNSSGNCKYYEDGTAARAAHNKARIDAMTRIMEAMPWGLFYVPPPVSLFSRIKRWLWRKK